MRGALFGDQVKNYEEAFMYNGVYEIANAPIKACDVRWKTDPSDLNFQMTFGRQTVIQPVDEVIGSPLIDYKCISQIPRLPNADERFDVLGIVLFVEEATRQIVTAQNRELPVREIFITDQSSKQPLTISAWNDLAEKDGASLTGWVDKFIVVGFTTLKATTHKRLETTAYSLHNEGFSLTTIMSNTFITSPTGSQAEDLQQWATMNNTLLLCSQNRNLDVKYSVGAIHITNIAAVLAKQVKNTLQEEKHRLKIMIPKPEMDKPNAYLGCSNCEKKTDFPAGQAFSCDNCSQKRALCCPRITFHCDVSDDTTTLDLTFFANDAEVLFGSPAEDLFRIKHTDDVAAFQVLVQKLKTEATVIEVGPKGILVRNGILQWVLKKVVRGSGVGTSTNFGVPSTAANLDSMTASAETFVPPPPPKAQIQQCSDTPATPKQTAQTTTTSDKTVH